MRTITKAIVPVAGLATRFLSATIAFGWRHPEIGGVLRKYSL